MSVSKRSFSKDSKILLLGGTGFLGVHLYDELTRRGYKHVFVGSRNAMENQPGHIRLDICEKESSVQITSGNFDIIYNLTGQITSPILACLEQNSNGIINISNAVNSSNAFLLHVSTVGVFGSVAYADENTVFSPETPYSTSKAIAETILGKYLSPEKYSVIRISNLYGNKQPKGVFAYLMRSAVSDRKLEFNNNGYLTRYYLHVEDCANALVDLVDSDQSPFHGKFNLVGNDRYTLKELIAVFEECTNIHFSSSFEPVKPYDNTLEIHAAQIQTHIHTVFKNSIVTYIAEYLKKQIPA